ncbi:hypothetical protein MPTK1_3g08670 [Marchantia polymorpha subsp. ruderalis]|uniref:non-specific serine/threonine protein kinase n=2 Tax=Marchantia polymorpha TaxID=3197 RepID=A0AAF6AYR9_MARPO|nr:hypothetical protein MARPO_0105s0050 [Marchantia polymorpha]PTQ31943.1 hypothetical protein MARPO_0105s0050 [Marchantia polymorpha]BBN04902.1 hypothetical protein Mp_3g08670 [Marchantia polymorpha subsp. ruderalis]BBN04903.1 hypothetical protein Mp_3g08670 [Marchantia polymorpha subsp. ruderalis]|eukprot:PTQ31942.1 hypothetical protein MARPO_0105s0050 [Marchantia polymorpha]
MKIMERGRRHWAPTVLVALAVCVAHIFGVAAQTDPADQQILESLLQGLTSASQATLGWSGGDACGGKWAHIQCLGTKVSAIQIGKLGLEGTIPSTINQLQQLTRLELQDNSFTGSLPSLSGLAKLDVGYFQNNKFDVIPGDFFDGLTSLTGLYLDRNADLNGTSGWTIPPSVEQCTALVNLSMTGCNVAGTIPDFLGTMTKLRVLNLAYNKMSGGIPATFSGSNLVQLQVNNQQAPVFDGSIEAVGGMKFLKVLWLHVNAFTGPIPAGLGDATSLEDLRLNDNKLVGTIPQSFARLALQSFSVRNNMLIGPIPSFQTNFGPEMFANNGFCSETVGDQCSTEVTALMGFLGAVKFSPSSLVETWSGNDPCGWTGIACNPSTKSVTSINLPNNELTGEISPTIASLSSLTTISLSGNQLSGTIPTELTNLKNLKTLDLSDNNLSPPLPEFADGVLVVTGNPLLVPGTPVAPPTATTPPATPGTPPASAGTPPAAPAPPGSPPATETPAGVPPTAPGPAVEGSSKSSSNTGIIVGVVAGSFVLILFATFGFCCVYKRKRKRLLTLQGPNTVMVHPRDSASDPEVVKIVVNSNANTQNTDTHVSRASSGPSDIQVVEAGNLVISIQVLRSVTKNFAEENVLGRGGFGVVYKGELEDGTKIAVKRMEAAVVSSKGLSEFQAEIAVLTKVRHRHLVALLGYCAEGNERLLVYEYMPQGTLSQHLFEHARHESKPLDWNRRLSIALDVARGMEYLHSLAHKSFIHRDLKPSNILLGDDFRAKVSDFGLVKLAPEGKFSVETRLAGTFGYLAPEYAVTGRVTTKADVFSFGVVLMELITGRRALDETQAEENMHLVTWFRRMNASKDSFTKAIDSSIEVTEDSFRSILIVAELAGHCTAREPYQRPDMGHAVNVLAPLVEQWKPTDLDEDEGGIDLEMTLPQALKQWQMYEDSSMSGLDDTKVRLLGDVSQSDQGQGKEEPSKLRGFFKDISIKRL